MVHLGVLVLEFLYIWRGGEGARREGGICVTEL